MKIEIDKHSGFCFGVRNAIKKAEELQKNNTDFVILGDIVHNNQEIERLKKMGITTANPLDKETIQNKTILIRAHGEPPSTYNTLTQNKNAIVDATCPVVLKLQQRIKKSYKKIEEQNGQLIILGKEHHPEVKGLNGQTNNRAIIITTSDDIEKIDFSRPIELFSQTTMPLDLFNQIKEKIEQRAQNSVRIHDTICRQVANRVPHLQNFANQYDAILFISGPKSSNGKLLFEICKKQNQNTYFISSPNDINMQWFTHTQSIGICGATSTPQWLMELVKHHVQNELNVSE
jgi:4-hydroxy-3-methylbut-2-enyl diphosphate reductase